MEKQGITLFTKLFMLAVVAITAQVQALKPPVPGVLLDGFGRAELLVSNKMNEDKMATIYWNAYYNGTVSIVDSVLVVEAEDGFCYRFATNNDFTWKYCSIRLKGDSRAANDLIYHRIGAAERGDIDDFTPTERQFSVTLGPDSTLLPEISDTFQIMVIDLAKNGLAFGHLKTDTTPGASNAFQIGTWDAMRLEIDYIFMSNWNPLDPASPVLPAGSQLKSAAPVGVHINTGRDSWTVRTFGTEANSRLTLFDLQGKLMGSYALPAAAGSMVIDRSTLSAGSYIYAVRSANGMLLEKGLVNQR